MDDALTETDLLDRETLWHRVGGDAELLADITALFLEETPRLMAELRGALARDDKPQALRWAHRLRGASGDMSALRVAALAGQLESLGRQGQWDKADVFCQALEEELARLQPVLEALVRKNAA